MSSALVTGGGDGIGRGFAIQLAKQGFKGITVVDIDLQKAQLVAREINNKSSNCTAYAVQCDVTSDESQKRAFDTHISNFGSLDVAIINAGIMESGDLIRDTDDNAWKRTFNVNLLAVLVGTRLAARAMIASPSSQSRPAVTGTILITASAGGIFPMPTAPVYSVAKAGCVMLTRSLAPSLWRRHRIRLCSLCPQFTDTALVRSVRALKGDAVADELTKDVKGKLLTVDYVVDVGIAVLLDTSKIGECVLVLASGDIVGIQPIKIKALDLHRPTSIAPAMSTSMPQNQIHAALPKTARKIIVKQLSTNFREATSIIEFLLPQKIPDGYVLVKNYFVGINASDINFTSGKYQGTSNNNKINLPFDAGFEATGIVVASSEKAHTKNLPINQPVATMCYGAFSEYSLIPSKQCIPIPRPSPEIVALLTSGLTASIALEQAGKIKTREVVLVTAAAGGTGQFFVQLAKAAGNHVIATCGSEEKKDFLMKIGADRVVNYHTESLKEILKKEYPTGIDLIFELVGGDMFKVCLNALANKGRLVVIGAMSQYAGGWKPSVHTGLPEKLLTKSARLIGFFLPMYASLFKSHLYRLISMVESGKLHVALDNERFVGIDSISRAVDRLQSGSSFGKVYVDLRDDGKRPKL